MTSEIQQQLKISEQTTKKLASRHFYNLWDLVLHLPLHYEDETHITPIADAMIGTTCQIQGIVLQQEITFRPRKQLIVRIEDSTGKHLYLRFLNFYPSHQQQLAKGKTIRALGEIRRGFYGNEMIHPKIKDAKDTLLPEHLTPIYPAINGLNQTTIKKTIQATLKKADLSDSLPENIRQQLQLPPISESIYFLHHPPPNISIDTINDKNIPAWQRLKFDELLAQQLSMCLSRQKRHSGNAPALISQHFLSQQLLQQLPFQLTTAQQRVLTEIRQDLTQNIPMNRLLQGDVGSGKTIIAALAALTALEAADNFQVAIMAPTEILAEQHYLKFRQWLEPLNITVAWFSGSQKKKEREQAKTALADGRIRLAIGTHALFQEEIQFHHLGLIIIDEQHRFGVTQRLALKNKGQAVHQLMMSATPIPRTLAMSFFADLDVSSIDELPPGRTPIQTKLINNSRRLEVEGYVLKTCQQGNQVYWVCPLIEESEALQLQTATETLEELQKNLPKLNIGLIHGKMKATEKAQIMNEFIQGHINVLVATTVIEVGVDVPNASLIVIEHAERMGLAQLHQLRGRVGRGQTASTCILLFSEPLSEISKARLKVIYENTDGFEIARQDLAIRGPGEFLGAKQSGIPMLRFADLQNDIHLLEAARNIAPILLSQYPEHAQKHLDRWLGYKKNFLTS